MEYAISVCEMSKPEVRSQKPKPEAMFCRRRLSATLLTISQTAMPSGDDQNDLVDDLPDLGAIEEARLCGLARPLTVVTAIARPRSSAHVVPQ